MKNNITKFQNDQINKFGLASPYSAISNKQGKSAVVSPERSESRLNTDLKNTPELTLNDLTTENNHRKCDNCK